MDSDTSRCIEFWGADEKSLSQIVEHAIRLGLATAADPVDPDTFLTLHMDLSTAEGLDLALATSTTTEPVGETTIDSLRYQISEWKASRRNKL